MCFYKGGNVFQIVGAADGAGIDELHEQREGFFQIVVEAHKHETGVLQVHLNAEITCHCIELFADSGGVHAFNARVIKQVGRIG